MKIEGVRIAAVFGCVPKHREDNLAELTKLTGAEKAAAIVKATGFATRRKASAGMDVIDLVMPAAKRAMEGVKADEIAGVIGVSFSGRERFPAMATRLQAKLGLRKDIAAYDISMACSGYGYGLWAAMQLAAATGGKVLLADGDIQSKWTDEGDLATLAVMSDGASATLVEPGEGEAEAAFLTDGAGGDVLKCDAKIAMDGFGVFRFVAGEVREFLKRTIGGRKIDAFVPHQANMYMVRQLADSLGLTAKLKGCGEKYGNTGSCSAALTLADGEIRGKTLVTGFGAGLSAAAIMTDMGEYRHGVEET